MGVGEKSGSGGVLVKDIFLEQKKTAIFLRGSGFEERIESLELLKKVLLKNEKELCDALFADFGKSVTETQITEIYPTIKEINEAIKSVRTWMRPRCVGSSMMMGFGKSWIQYQPKGVSLVVSPWNYPIYLSFSPLIAALAAGCTAILKPSEFVPNVSRVLKRILNEAFASNLIFVVEGGVAEANELLQLPFDHIFFTGSTEVGKVYMAAAAKHLSSITLELGGKSPTIVDSSADLKLSAEKIAWGKFINAGQTCIAPDYLLVQESIWPEFKEHLKTAIQNLYPAGKNSLDLCQIVNEKHHSRLTQLLEDAKTSGAEIIAGGGFEANQRKLDPTCLLLKSDNVKIMKEEIFGPLLPLLLYKTNDDAIEFINSREKPLALYIFARSNEVIEKYLTQTSSGGVCINEVLLHIGNEKLPFGGVNHSGLGSYHGEFGFRTFSHERGIYKQSALGRLMKVVYPPYTDRIRGLVRKMIDWNL